MVLAPLIVSKKLLKIGDRLTDSILFSCLEVATYTLCKLKEKPQVFEIPFMTFDTKVTRWFWAMSLISEEIERLK